VIALLVGAETRKLLSRTAAKGGLVLALLCGVFGPLLLNSLASGAEINGQDLSTLVPYHAPGGLQWALELRNFFIIKMVIVVLAASSFAGELQARTLREDLLRPVRRDAVLLSKWAALVIWTGLATLATLIGALASGVVVFGFDGPWSVPLPGYAVSWLCDAGFAAVALAVAVWVRSVPMAVGATFLMTLLLQVVGFLTWLLALAGKTLPIEDPPQALIVAKVLYPWMPSAAFDAWKGYRPMEPWPFGTIEGVWYWESFLGLGVLTVVCLLITKVVFDRLDVP
jgi:ABC-type transport system involved in multi-copper enzyme maturation permease subunit